MGNVNMEKMGCYILGKELIRSCTNKRVTYTTVEVNHSIEIDCG